MFVDDVVGGVGGCGVGIASLLGRATESEGLHGCDGEIGDKYGGYQLHGCEGT